MWRTSHPQVLDPTAVAGRVGVNSKAVERRRHKRNREHWLTEAVAALAPIVEEEGYKIRPVDVSVGFPSRGGLSSTKPVISQCWHPTAAEDGVPHIFISPLLDGPLHVLSAPMHAVIHVTTPGEGHKGAVVENAKKVGFPSPWTSPPMGDDLHPRLDKIASRLGDYPHSKLNPAESPIKKQTTRMRAIRCVECGWLCRATLKWIEAGLPTCHCGGEMEADVE